MLIQNLIHLRVQTRQRQIHRNENKSRRSRVDNLYIECKLKPLYMIIM